MVARIARARFLILAILRSKNTRCRVVGITVTLPLTATRGAWTSSRRVAPRLRPGAGERLELLDTKAAASTAAGVARGVAALTLRRRINLVLSRCVLRSTQIGDHP